ncbi:tail fiber assembly protein [Escherichia coli]
MKYARIENGIVAELVDVPDGVDISDLYHPDLRFVDVSGADPQPDDGWTYADGVFAAPVYVATPEDNLIAAQVGYDRATDAITELNEQIEDADYAGTTEEAVKAELAAWTDYRKKLRAYIKSADGSQPVPSAPV